MPATASEPQSVLPAGLTMRLEALTPQHETRLIGLIETSGLRYPPYDPGNARSSASYGWKYDYQGDRFQPCPPLPEGFAEVAAIAAAFAGKQTGDLAECLLNRYEPGALIQSHIDKPVWDLVIGISLGSASTMVFSRPAPDSAGREVIPVRLEPRSMFILSGDSRHAFEHALEPMQDMRWSITFRTFSQEGLARLRENAAEI